MFFILFFLFYFVLNFLFFARRTFEIQVGLIFLKVSNFVNDVVRSLNSLHLVSEILEINLVI